MQGGLLPYFINSVRWVICYVALISVLYAQHVKTLHTKPFLRQQHAYQGYKGEINAIPLWHLPSADIPPLEPD